MASQAPKKAVGGLPPAAPTISTQEEAQSLTDVAFDWIIVARRPNGQGEWEPTMPYEDWRLLKEIRDDNGLLTTQRRDPAGTVLLAKLKGPSE
jgi:hypothetical protein